MQGLKEAAVSKKAVLIRLDLNVPLHEKGGERLVKSDFRIKAILPTLKYLIQNQAKTVILSHLGRPEGHFVPNLSLKPVAKYLSSHLKTSITYTDDVLNVDSRRAVAGLRPGQVFMLGNLRFTEEEEANNRRFAEELASLGDLFVNEAFSVSHRAHASIVGIPKFSPSYAGFRFVEEVNTLTDLLYNPPKPFVVLLGGAKLKDKIDTLKHILPIADRVILGGAVANTFLKARGENISLSVYEPAKLELAEELLEKYPDKLLLPVDWLVDYPSANTFRILDVGPLSLKRFELDIIAARTIFWNGNFGLTEDKRFRNGTDQIIKFLSSGRARTIVSGGDTVGEVDDLKLTERFSFVSTGGGATLEFLAGTELPGVVALKNALQYKMENKR